MQAMLKKLNFKTLLLYGVLILSSLVLLVPVIWMIAVSLAHPEAVHQRIMGLIPIRFSLHGYYTLFAQTPYSRWFLNSIFVSTMLTLGQLFVGIFAAYAFARYDFKGREILFFFVLCTMMIPPQAILLPTFMVVNELEWINTFRGVIIPRVAQGYAIFVLRQFFLQVPESLDESAAIDGCNSWQTLYHVYVRTSIPAVIAVGLIQLVQNWNEYYWPLVVLMDMELLTLPLGIVTFRDETLVRWAPTMAAATLAVLPVLIVYILGQKHFIKSQITSGID